MKYITLIRHADALPASAGEVDKNRVLSPRGEAMAQSMGARLASQKLFPDLVFSSSAKRAIHTCQIICDEVQYPINEVQADPSIYYARSAEFFLELFARVDESLHNIWLFGHNPYISAAASLLTQCDQVNKGAQAVGMVVCGVYRLALDVEYWAEILPGEGRLVEYLMPDRM